MLLQDGGDGQIGRVIDVRGWDDESARSVANVEWSSGSTNVYRLGHKGKVDLRVVHSTVGGSYFREALPVVSNLILSGRQSQLSGVLAGTSVASS